MAWTMGICSWQQGLPKSRTFYQKFFDVIRTKYAPSNYYHCNHPVLCLMDIIQRSFLSPITFGYNKPFLMNAMLLRPWCWAFSSSGSVMLVQLRSLHKYATLLIYISWIVLFSGFEGKKLCTSQRAERTQKFFLLRPFRRHSLPYVAKFI